MSLSRMLGKKIIAELAERNDKKEKKEKKQKTLKKESRTSFRTSLPEQHQPQLKSSEMGIQTDISPPRSPQKTRRLTIQSSQLSELLKENAEITRQQQAESRKIFSELITEQEKMPPPESRTPEQQKLFNALLELCVSEADYLRDLQAIQKIWMDPMSKILGPADKKRVFGELPMITNLHQNILNDLKNPKNRILQVYARAASFLRMYQLFCASTNHVETITSLANSNPQFKKIHEEGMITVEACGLNMSAFLIKPVQRLCKYPLLFNNIRQHTSKDHPLYSDLQKIVEEFGNTVALVNQIQKVTEETIRLENIARKVQFLVTEPISDYKRTFIKDGRFVLYSPNLSEHWPCYLLLCSDMMYVFQCKGESPVCLVEKIFLHNLQFYAHNDLDCVAYCIELVPEIGFRLMISCRNEEEFQVWPPLLKKTISAFKPNQQVIKKQIEDTQRAFFEFPKNPTTTFLSQYYA